MRSRSDNQLGGKGGASSSCSPQQYINSSVTEAAEINPCGLIAWSFFNDTFSATQGGAAVPINVSSRLEPTTSHLRHLESVCAILSLPWRYKEFLTRKSIRLGKKHEYKSGVDLLNASAQYFDVPSISAHRAPILSDKQLPSLTSIHMFFTLRKPFVLHALPNSGPMLAMLQSQESLRG